MILRHRRDGASFLYGDELERSCQCRPSHPRERHSGMQASIISPLALASPTSSISARAWKRWCAVEAAFSTASAISRAHRELWDSLTSRSEYIYGTAGTYPLQHAAAAPIPFTLDPPYTLSLPSIRTCAILASTCGTLGLQQNLGDNRSMKLTYVGKSGRDLLRNEMLTPAMGGNPNFQISRRRPPTLIYSNYNALQVEFKQQPLASSPGTLPRTPGRMRLDNGSGVALPIPYYTVYNPNLDYGSSDFDIRNTLTNAITYELPKVTHGNASSVRRPTVGLSTASSAPTPPSLSRLHRRSTPTASSRTRLPSTSVPTLFPGSRSI